MPMLHHENNIAIRVNFSSKINKLFFFCLEDIYSFGSLFPAFGILINLMTIVNVLEDLYSLMDSAADMAEEQGLQQATLRDMKR